MSEESMPVSLQGAKEALEKAKAASDQKAELTAMLQVTQFAVEAGEIKEAQSTASEARVLAKKLGEAKMEVDAVSANVTVLIRIGEYDEATREAFDALSICRRKGDEAAESDALAMVVYAHHLSLSKDNAKKGKTQIEEDAFKEGVKELTQTALDSVKLTEKLGDEAKLARAYVSLAGVYMLNGEPDMAKSSAKKAYAIFNDLKDGNGYYDACMALANAHIQRGDFASAMRYANEAKELCVQFQDSWGVSTVNEFILTIKECIYASQDLKNSVANSSLEMLRVSLS